jgi:hypothetical protein
MNVMPTCFAKDCDKPRFREYYVCAEHFVFYAAQRYPETTACSSSQPEHTAGKSPEREIPREVNRARNTH